MPLAIAACTPDDEIGSMAKAASPTAADCASIGASQTYGVASAARGGSSGSPSQSKSVERRRTPSIGSSAAPNAIALNVPSGSAVPHSHELSSRSTSVRGWCGAITITSPQLAAISGAPPAPGRRVFGCS